MASVPNFSARNDASFIALMTRESYRNLSQSNLMRSARLTLTYGERTAELWRRERTRPQALAPFQSLKRLMSRNEAASFNSAR